MTDTEKIKKLEEAKKLIEESIGFVFEAGTLIDEVIPPNGSQHRFAFLRGALLSVTLHLEVATKKIRMGQELTYLLPMVSTAALVPPPKVGEF